MTHKRQKTNVDTEKAMDDARAAISIGDLLTFRHAVEVVSSHSDRQVNLTSLSNLSINYLYM